MKDYTDYSCTGQGGATEGKTDKGIKIACACATAGLLMLFALVGTAIAQDAHTPGEGAPALVAENGKALPGGKATDAKGQKGSGSKAVGDRQEEGAGKDAPEGGEGVALDPAAAESGATGTGTGGSQGGTGTGTGGSQGGTANNGGSTGSGGGNAGTGGSTGGTGGTGSGGTGNNNATAPAPAPAPEPEPIYGWVTQPWTETVQHPGVWGIVGQEYHDYCNTCGAILDSNAMEHLKTTQHAGHHGRYVPIEGWVTQPWTETIEHPGTWGIIGYR